jgi:hypothetical protein
MWKKSANIKTGQLIILVVLIGFMITGLVLEISMCMGRSKNKKMRTIINEQPKELGKVSWYRNYEEAIAESSRSGKPVFLLFQEVPGCSNCINFGHDLLSYPLFVEAIENEFVPLAIYNNVAGADQIILNKFNERPWNNPVVRFVDQNGIDLIPKLEFSLNPFLLHEKMKQVMLLNKDQVPPYFELLAGELKILHGLSAVTYYETPCFWSGETSMIQSPMVLSTEAGWMGDKEVVKVHYDPTKGSLEELNSYALEQGFYLLGTPAKYRKDVHPQYYLKGSVFGSLPLSYTQRSILNYAIPYRKDGVAETYLSPLQCELLLHHRNTDAKGKLVYDNNIEDIWPFRGSGKSNTNL